MMKNILQKFTNKFFGDRLDFRAKIFNATMFIMAGTWTIGAFSSMLAARGESLAGIPALVCAGLIACLIWYANKSGNYKRCYWIMTIVMFMGQAGMAFFLNGGYNSGGVFAILITNVAVTAFLFEGKKAIIVPSILIVEYAALCVYAYYYPDKINYFDEQNRFFSTVSILILTCVTISAIIILHLRLHDRQKRELEEARNVAEEARGIAENAFKKAVEYEKMKSEFFADMSHELRTPLTIISASAQLAAEQIKSNDISEQTLCDLSAISQEATRLANMADCALKTLTMPFESGGVECLENQYLFTPLHIGDLADVISGIVKPVVIQKGKTLNIHIDEELPLINGDKDTLIRLMLNLLHNAVCYGGKNIVVRAEQKDDSVILTIKDNGAGIPQELLPIIFNRGVSGTGSAGLGLYVSKEIVQAHNGDIKIENINKGVCVTVMLPITNV